MRCGKWWEVTKEQLEEIDKLEEKGIDETCVTMGFRKRDCQSKEEKEKKREASMSPKPKRKQRRTQRPKLIIEQKETGALDKIVHARRKEAIRNRIQMSKYDLDLKAVQGKFTSYIPGRDEMIWPNSEIIDYEGRTRMIYMEIHAEYRETFTENAHKYLETFISLYRQKKLPENCDGRQSAGPLDVTRFSINDQTTLGQYHPNKSINALLNFGNLFHIHQDGRKAFLGDINDEHGRKKASFMKGWKSHPIPSWSGGSKLCGVTRKIVMNQLSKIQEIRDSETFLSLAAKALWKQFRDMLPQAADFHMRYKEMHEMGDVKDVFEGTGWNAYSVNVNFRYQIHSKDPFPVILCFIFFCA